MPKISIVVPVYNCEKYINRCLDSIAAQTFTEFECIVIDDGSTDNSPVIIDKYPIHDQRFTVIHQTNGGVSVARNAGLEKCSCDWCAFVDSDDWLEPCMLEEMYDTVQLTGGGYDMILCKIQDTAEIKVYSLDSSYLYLNGKYGLCYQSAWGKLYRRAVITSHKLSFPTGVRLGEDTFFTFTFLTHSPKTYFVNKPLYHYFNDRSDSAVNSISYDSAYSARKSFTLLSDYINENNCMKRFEKTLFDMKLWVKNLFVDQMNPSDSREWRKTFPELNKKLLVYKGHGIKRCILYFLLVTRIYDIFKPIMVAYKNRKK